MAPPLRSPPPPPPSPLPQVYVENAGAIKFYKKRKYKEVFEDNRIQRPVGSSIFGIRWTEFNHKVMVKNLSKSFF